MTAWFVSLPGQYSFQSATVMFVVYAGEKISVTISGSGAVSASATVDGYLLNESGTP